jgi:hypothetical protein
MGGDDAQGKRSARYTHLLVFLQRQRLGRGENAVRVDGFHGQGQGFVSSARRWRTSRAIYRRRCADGGAGPAELLAEETEAAGEFTPPS